MQTSRRATTASLPRFREKALFRQLEALHDFRGWTGENEFLDCRFVGLWFLGEILVGGRGAFDLLNRFLDLFVPSLFACHGLNVGIATDLAFALTEKVLLVRTQ